MSNSNGYPLFSLSRSGCIMLLLIGVLLAGCGPGGDAGAPGDVDGETLVVNLGGTTVPGTPGEAIMLSFKENAERASGGHLELRPLIYGQLGSEEQLLSGLRRGRIQFANLSAQVTSTIVPELALLYAPYLFDNEAEADHIYDTYLTDIYRQLLADANLHLITWYEIGFHSVYGKRPLLTPADVAGVRFRVSSSLNARLFAEAIGADVIPLGYGDIVSGLQTGLIDAGENSISLYARTGIAGEAPHYTLTRHAFGMSVIVADLNWWTRLDATDRRILEEAFPTIEESRRLTRAQDLIDLDDPGLGIITHELTRDQRQLWKDATADVTDELIDKLGGRSREIYETILRGKQEFTKRRSRAD